MLTWTFISRSEPAILRRTWSHAHLSLLQGTSLQFSKRIVLGKENKNPPESSAVLRHELQFACESFATEFPPFHRSQTGQTLSQIPAKTLIKNSLSAPVYLFYHSAPADWFQDPHYCSLVSGLLLTNFTDKMPHVPSNDHHNNPSSEQPLMFFPFFFLLTIYVIMNSHIACWK